MLAKAAVELRLRRGIETEEARPTPRGHRAANIDRPFAIRKRDRTISGKVTLVVNRVDTRALKPVGRRKGITWAQQQRPAHAPAKLNTVQRIEGMLADSASLVPLTAVGDHPGTPRTAISGRRSRWSSLDLRIDKFFGQQFPVDV